MVEMYELEVSENDIWNLDKFHETNYNLRNLDEDCYTKLEAQQQEDRCTEGIGMVAGGGGGLLLGIIQACITSQNCQSGLCYAVAAVEGIVGVITGGIGITRFDSCSDDTPTCE